MVNAMLLNEFLKEHKTIEQQRATIAKLKSAIAQQQQRSSQQEEQIAALTSGLQKVSAQVEMLKATQWSGTSKEFSQPHWAR
jgi:septal ring factor EnvC (AmiA/AmiB activator)